MRSDPASSRSTSAFDLPLLLAPLPGPSPVGVYIRDEPAYAQLMEARRAENASLPQGVWKRDVKRADWGAVVEQASMILSQRSKDLQVAVWLIEAETQRHGFGGMIDGFTLIEGLCEQFWLTIYPPLDPADPEVRSAPFDWLNEKLPVLLQQIPITLSGAGSDVSYSWTDYINAQHHEVARQKDPKSASQSEELGRITLAEFSDGVAQTSTSFLEEIYRDLKAAEGAARALQSRLDVLAGRAAPSIIGLIKQIEEIGDWTRARLIERGALVTIHKASDGDRDGDSEIPDSELGVEGAAYLEISSREQAYHALASAANYLFKTEPHSPVPYLVHRAINWGHMPLHELLPELIRGTGNLSLMLELLGIEQPPSGQVRRQDS